MAAPRKDERKKKAKPRQIRFTKETDEWLRSEAARLDISVSSVIDQVLKKARDGQGSPGDMKDGTTAEP